VTWTCDVYFIPIIVNEHKKVAAAGFEPATTISHKCATFQVSPV